MTIRILVGDVRQRLAEIPGNSIQCCVTSPPYFGLRDYGTALWDGGDPECDHRHPKTGNVAVSLATSTLGGSTTTQGHQQNSQGRLCGKCGAVRIDNQIGLEPRLDCDRRGLFRLRSDLTEAQREYVVRRFLGAAPSSSGCGTDGTASSHSTARNGGRDAQPKT